MTLREYFIHPTVLSSKDNQLTSWQKVRVYNTCWSRSLSWTGPLYIAIMLVITCRLTWSSRRLEPGRGGRGSMAYGFHTFNAGVSGQAAFQKRRFDP